MDAKIKINIKNLANAEQRAKEILEHIEAIKRLERESSWTSADVEIVIDKKIPR